jgi:hypothetical protein
LFALSGKNDSTGDIILKVVNSASTACDATVQLNGLHNPGVTAVLTTLSAPSGESENSFSHPYQYIPRDSTLTGVFSADEKGLSGRVRLSPYSISILRIKDAGALTTH